MRENGPLSGTRGPVASAIRDELDAKAMSARELARRTGMTYAAFGRRMTGETPFTVDELVAVAAQLSVPPASLLPEPEPAHAT